MPNNFIKLLVPLMKQRKLSQSKLANISGIPRETIRSWFKRDSSPREWESIIQIAAALQVDQATAAQLLNAAGHPSLATLQQLSITEINDAHLAADEFRIYHYQTLKENLDQWFSREGEANQQPHSGDSPSNEPLSNDPHSESMHLATQVDGGELPSRQSTFFGRGDELAQLEELLSQDQTRLLTIAGNGGIGKTTLAAQLVHSLVENTDQNQRSLPPTTHQFSHIIWRSLINSPPLESILKIWLQSLLPSGSLSYPESIDEQIDLLFSHLQQHRCLLVLDNFESILAAGEQAGHYRAGYELYSRLLQRFGSTEHKSCLLITSRETPIESARLGRTFCGVQTVSLGGLSSYSGAELLESIGLPSSAEMTNSLIERYSGNPLGLKLVAETVVELYAGNIKSFLADEAVVFDDIHEVLEQQYNRLSEIEQAILVWLTVEREPVTIQTLQENLLKKISSRELREALMSLLRRSIIEIRTYTQPSHKSAQHNANNGTNNEGRFLLQNVIMEYMTDKIIQKAVTELIGGSMDFVTNHALIKAQSHSYVIDAQRRLLLDPVAKQLLSLIGQPCLMDWAAEKLDSIRKTIGNSPSYVGGTLLNLLLHLRSSGYPNDLSQLNLSQLDFSGLSLWHTILHDQKLQDINFAGSDLSYAKFTGTFCTIWGLVYSPDGKFLIAGTDNGSIRIWQSADLKLIAELYGHTGLIRSGAVTENGDTFITGSEDGTVRVWDISQLTVQGNSPTEALDLPCIQILDCSSYPVSQVTISPNGHTLATASFDGIIRTWTLSDNGTFELSQQLQGHGAHKYSGRVRSISFHPQGDLLASCGDDGAIRLWDLNTAACIHTHSAHRSYAHQVAISPDGSLLASCGADGMIHLWEIAWGSNKDGPDEDLIDERLVKLCNQRTFTGHTLPLYMIAFSPDGSSLASCGEDETVLIWDVMSGVSQRRLHGHSGWIRALTFAPDGNVIATAGIDVTLRLWDAESGESINNLHGYSITITSVAISPDENQLITGDHTPRLWTLADGQRPQELSGHDSFIWQVDYSRNGKLVASASDDASIRLWDAQTGKPIYKFQADSTTYIVKISRDAKWLAGGEFLGKVTVWDVESGRLLFSWSEATDIIWDIDYCRENKYIAAGCEDGNILILNLQSRDLSRVIKAHSEPIRAVAFSPTRQIVASGSRDKTITLWDYGTGSQVATLSAHEDLVSSLRFSDDGKALISASYDQSICLWDMDSHKLISRFSVHEGAIRSIDYAQKSKSVISGGDDGTIKITKIGQILAHPFDSQAEGLMAEALDVQVLRVPGPYAGMNITGVTGITPTQQKSLIELGAFSSDFS